MDITLQPELNDALATLAATVESFAAEHSLVGEVSFRLNLALDELVTNCITYSLPKVAQPWLRIRLEHKPDGLLAWMEDNGPAFDPLSEAPPPDTSQQLDDRPVGGLGVFLVTQFADSVDYTRENGVNRITLRMKLET